MKNKGSFWSDINRVNSNRAANNSPVVDGVSGTKNITNIFACKFSSLLNRHSPSPRNSLLASIQASPTELDVSLVTISEDDVFHAISQLKSQKSDASGITV